MTCRDFERRWNELLDAGPQAEARISVLDLEQGLRAHATDCPACNQIALRYQVLERAILAWSGPPAAPAQLADKILGEAQRPSSRRWLDDARRAPPIWRIGLPLATAAAAAIALVYVRPAIDGWRSVRRTTTSVNVAAKRSADAFSQPDSGARTIAVSVDTRAFHTALAEATSATWELARSASEPAARISRQVLDAATNHQPGSTTAPALDERTGGFMVSVSSYMPTPPDPAAASAMLRQVGDRLATGVGPLSTTARHAFGFLLGSTVARPGPRVTPTNVKGA